MIEIVEFDGKFAVRETTDRMTGANVVFYDENLLPWITLSAIKKYCLFETYDEAMELAGEVSETANIYTIKGEVV